MRVLSVLLMAAYNNKENSKMEKLLEACERFRFLTFAVTGRRSNTGDYRIYALAHEFYSGQTKTFDDLIKEIKDQTDYWFDISLFISSAVDRYQKREGFYSWSGLRYFLYEYERNLQNKTKDKDQIVSWEIFEKNQENKISIEHIYPQSPTDIYWTSRFTTEKDKCLTHSLGNLLLLSVAKNSEEQNDAFDKKKLTKRNADGTVEHNGYDEGSYSEKVVSREKEWTPDCIIERGKNLLSFLKDHWDIKHVFTDEEINKLLNISGVKSAMGINSNVADQPDWEETENEE